jgi:hypothetical protein
MMNFVRLAYPYFEEDLEDALAEVKGKSGKETAYCHLQNLKSFCIFFIPAVRHTTRKQRAEFYTFFGEFGLLKCLCCFIQTVTYKWY